MGRWKKKQSGQGLELSGVAREGGCEERVGIWGGGQREEGEKPSQFSHRKDPFFFPTRPYSLN